MTPSQIKTARTHGIGSFSQFAALEYLMDHGKTATGPLGEHLATTAANITGIIDTLKDNGLVVRTGSRTDRRVIFVSLTWLGEEVARAVHGRPALVCSLL
jgi:DNA-binding MarR family transcriptional regulator